MHFRRFTNDDNCFAETTSSGSEFHTSITRTANNAVYSLLSMREQIMSKNGATLKTRLGVVEGH